MFFRSKRSFRGRLGRRYRRRPYRRNYRKKTGLRKVIKRVLRKSLESKHAWVDVTGGSGPLGIIQGYQSTGVMNNGNYLLPSITQGTTDYGRIGDVIKPSSLKVHYQLSYPPSQTTLGAQYIRVIICSSKGSAGASYASTLPSADSSALLLKASTPTTFSSVMNDITAPINHARFNVYHDRVYTVSPNVCPTSITSGATNMAHLGNNFHRCTVNLSKHFKTLKYDNAGTYPNQPTNHNLWMICQAVNADGSVGSTANNVNGAVISIQTDMWFKDA